MASICNDERACFDVMSGHDGKTLSLSAWPASCGPAHGGPAGQRQVDAGATAARPAAAARRRGRAGTWRCRAWHALRQGRRRQRCHRRPRQTSRRCLHRTTRPAPWPWWAAVHPRGRARSAWPMAACCSWTNCRSSRAARSRRCASRWRPAASPTRVHGQDAKVDLVRAAIDAGAVAAGGCRAAGLPMADDSGVVHPERGSGRTSAILPTRSRSQPPVTRGPPPPVPARHAPALTLQIASGSTSTAQRNSPLCWPRRASSSGSHALSMRCSTVREGHSSSICMRSTSATLATGGGTGG